MGLSSESACASLSSVHSKSLLRLSHGSLRELPAENGEDGVEKQRMSTKELLRQCLAQVVQQISLFNETLKQTKKNGSLPVQVTPTANATGAGKPAKKRGRPPGSKNKSALNIPSFHDLHHSPELHFRTPSSALHDPDSADADGTHTDASGPVGEDGARVHGSQAEASSVLSEESEDHHAVHASYEDRLKALNNKYEVGQDPGRPVTFLVYKILEMLGKGPVAEKVLRSSVMETCKDAGIKTSGKTAASSAAGFDFNVAIGVMKGVQLVCEKDDSIAPEAGGAAASSAEANAQRSTEPQSSVLSKTIYERWPEAIDSFTLALANKRAELAAQAAAAAAAGSSSSTAAAAAAKDAGSAPATETKLAQASAAFASPLGLPLTPVDWQLSLLDPQTLSQMMQWVQQMTRHADQFLTPRSAAESRLPPGLDTLLGLKDPSLHTDMVVEELLRQMTLPLSMSAAAFDPGLLASIAEAQSTLQQQQQQASAHRRVQASSSASSSTESKAAALAAKAPATSSADGGSSSVRPELKLHEAGSSQLSSGSTTTATAAVEAAGTTRKRPSRSFELSAPVERILQNAGARLQEWGQVCYEEARLLEEEENLLRRLAKRCGLNLPSLQTQSQTVRVGSKYLSADAQAQARPLLWDGVPLTASLLWERARKAKRQRIHGYGASPPYPRPDDLVPPTPGHSVGSPSITPPFLARRRSGASATTDYPAHRVPPMRLHPAVPFMKEIPRDHTQPIELPDLIIRSCVIPWTDIAKEFVPLKAPIDGTPMARDDSDVFAFADARSEDGSRSEDMSDAASIAPVLKRQKSEVLAPTFRVVADASTSSASQEEQKATEPAQPQPPPPATAGSASTSSSARRIEGGYRIAVTGTDAVDSGSDSESEEDISDEAVAARHEVVLQRMRDRFKKLQELKNKQQEQLSISAPQGAHPSASVTSPKKGRKGKAKSQRSHGRKAAPLALLQECAPPPPKPDAFCMPFATTTAATSASSELTSTCAAAAAPETSTTTVVTAAAAMESTTTTMAAVAGSLMG